MTIAPHVTQELMHKLIPALENIFCRCFVSPDVDDNQKWHLISLFGIKSLRLGGDERAFAKLWFLVLLIGSKDIASRELCEKIVQNLDWITEGIVQGNTCFLTPNLHVTTPLYHRVWFVLCKFCLKLNDLGMLDKMESYLVQLAFHQFFLCRQLATDVWAFLLQKGSQNLQIRHTTIFKELVSFLFFIILISKKK
jgi:hypothetical protein